MLLGLCRPGLTKKGLVITGQSWDLSTPYHIDCSMLPSAVRLWAYDSSAPAAALYWMDTHTEARDRMEKFKVKV